MTRDATASDYSLAALRIMTGMLFMQHGLQKIFHFPGVGHSAGPFDPLSMFGVAGMLETVGGALVAVGLLTRPAAFILSGEMAVAYFLIHFTAGLQMPNGLFPAVNGGDLAILFCFVFLHIALAGPRYLSPTGMAERTGWTQPTAFR